MVLTAASDTLINTSIAVAVVAAQNYNWELVLSQFLNTHK